LEGENIRLIPLNYHQRSEKAWDAAVFFIDPVPVHTMKAGSFPPYETLHTIGPDSAVYAMVLGKRPEMLQEGFQALLRNQSDLAISKLQDALELIGPDEGIYKGIGMAHLQAGKYDEALEAFQQSLELYGQNTLVYYYIAVAYLNKDEILKAIFYNDRAIQLNPNFKEAYLLMATLYTRKGDLNMADQFIQRSKSLE
jgi:tetratricopeptide (TPR) repeat protein